VRAAKACSDPHCPNLQPCPDHQREPWQGSRRRERMVLRSGSQEQKRREFVLMRDAGICHVCGLGGANEVDHVIPLSENGPDDLDNLRPIHSEPCHRQKTAKEAQRVRNSSR
jgi:5-methylcytosine-specific restriction endonuclease McrA